VVFYKPSASEMMGLLSRLRTAAGIVEVPAAAEAKELPKIGRRSAPPVLAQRLGHQACRHAGEAAAENGVFQGFTLPVYDGEWCSMLEIDELDGETAALRCLAPLDPWRQLMQWVMRTLSELTTIGATPTPLRIPEYSHLILALKG
jgi:hypothetical protein